jgi:cytochrome c oxidase cbb3-type subunit 3
MSRKEIDEPTGVETTGHQWDGIKELNNPLPRWWLIVMWICIAWAAVYWVLMPAWPGLTGHTRGLRDNSERRNVAVELAALDAARNAQMTRLVSVASIADIEKDPELLSYAINAGRSLFGDNCATCHGAGGQGFAGYPALVDDDWLWGGALPDIVQTIRYGIRSGHAETRDNIMQAYGKSGALQRDAISDIASYVLSLSGEGGDAASVARGAEIFSAQCASCHGENGVGGRTLGAPNLADGIWLYGGDRQTIETTIVNGRAGVMPNWNERLSEAEITALAVYVHTLGGGE